jgi:hypothetical protein
MQKSRRSRRLFRLPFSKIATGAYARPPGLLSSARACERLCAPMRCGPPCSLCAAPSSSLLPCLSLHDEVELSPTPWWNRRVLHRVLTCTRATNRTDCIDELASLLVTRREYRMQEMCVQYDLPPISLKRSSLQKPAFMQQVKILRVRKYFLLDSQRSSR